MITLKSSDLNLLFMVLAEAHTSHTAFFVRVLSHHVSVNCRHWLGGFNGSCYDFVFYQMFSIIHRTQIYTSGGGVGEEDTWEAPGRW